MVMNETCIKVLYACCCEYTKFHCDVKYYFKNSIEMNDDNIHITIWCEKLSHQLDLYITNENSNDTRLDHDFNIKFYHNDDVLLFTLTDMRLDLIPICINHEIDVIIEMNE